MVSISSDFLGRQVHKCIILSLPFLIFISVCIVSFSESSFNMRFNAATLALLPSLTQAVRIVQANDDGWAELYVRSFNQALNAAGHDVILSCPADNKSGSSASKPLILYSRQAQAH
jgi:ABC-type antimicrobial peptide transport system permease subunit